MSKENIVITGSGISALMMARMIRKYRNPDAQIIIIEREDKIGGQFGSVDYGTHGHFDYGMHIYYESCVKEIDELFTSLLPENEWNILVGNYKDAAGIYVNSTLQVKCPYVDLRNLPAEKLNRYTSALLLHIEKTPNADPREGLNAYELLARHFGKVIADEVFVPILEKLYLNHASNLDEIATKLTAINRVAMFDEKTMRDLMKSEAIRSRICYPDQYTLPPYRTNDQRGFYPKKYGMFRVLEKFKSTLEGEGVRFMNSTVITEMRLANSSVEGISFKNQQGTGIIENIRELYWTAGLPPLALTLKMDLSAFKNDRREAACYVNLLFDKKPEMDRLYYFYCFDKGFRTFRVTNYSNYCPDASSGRGYPVCVELWPEAGDPADEKEIIQLALKELTAFGVINSTFALSFGKVEKVHGGGFPLPTIRNISNMNTIRDTIKRMGIKNLIPVGVLAEKNIFFIKEVLIDAYQKVTGNKLQTA